jgi:uncharacterized membrane protein YqjE
MDAVGESPREGAAEEGAPATGIVSALRRMLATLVALVHTRLELFTTEIEEEIQRAASILLWALIALFFGSLTVLMVAVTVLIVFWDDHRILAAGLITGSFLLLTVVFALLARTRLRAKTRFMDASLDELQRDKESLERAL